MSASEPLAFGGVETVADFDASAQPAARLERRPELHAVARKVIAILEPLEPAARMRVIRAAAILLELDDTAFPTPWMR